MLFFSENKLHSHQICFAFGITRTLHHGLRFETIKKMVLKYKCYRLLQIFLPGF